MIFEGGSFPVSAKYVHLMDHIKEKAWDDVSIKREDLDPNHFPKTTPDKTDFLIVMASKGTAGIQSGLPAFNVLDITSTPGIARHREGDLPFPMHKLKMGKYYALMNDTADMTDERQDEVTTEVLEAWLQWTSDGIVAEEVVVSTPTNEAFLQQSTHYATFPERDNYVPPATCAEIVSMTPYSYLVYGWIADKRPLHEKCPVFVVLDAASSIEAATKMADRAQKDLPFPVEVTYRHKWTSGDQLFFANSHEDVMAGLEPGERHVLAETETPKEDNASQWTVHGGSGDITTTAALLSSAISEESRTSPIKEDERGAGSPEAGGGDGKPEGD